jgi:hypothetical protein
VNPHLRRVRRLVGPDVLAFLVFVRTFRDPPVFHLWEVEHYVAERTPAAPGTAARVLRSLRRQGIITYVVRRAESRYTLTRIDLTEGAQLDLIRCASTVRGPGDS